MIEKFYLILTILKRIIKVFEVKVERKFFLSSKPIFLNFLITYKCNSRCRMCGIWRRYLDDPGKVKEELSFEEIKSFIQGNKEWLSELKHIGITGGEPLLRSDLISIIRMMREELPSVAIGFQTNGLLPDLFKKTASEILTFYPSLSIAVSLDGVGETHGKIRGLGGAYKKATETIKIARDMGIKDITVGMTLSSLNYKEIPLVKKVAEGYGCEFSCFLADEGDYFNNKGKVSGLDVKAKNEVIKFLERFSYHYFMSNLRLQLMGKRERKLPCYSGWTSLVIDPYGDIKPCILKSETFGNVKKQPLKEMLNSENALKIRKMVKKCLCWNQCEVSTSAIVDPTDVIKWFIFYSDKKEFIRSMVPKLKKYF